MRRPIHALATVLAGALLLSGCGSGVTTPGGASAAGAVTVENCGREVTVSGTPSRAVGLHPAQTELLLRLGLADRLAGQAQTANRPLPGDVAPLAADVPVLGDAEPPSREKLLAARPDFVFSPTTYEFTAEQGFATIEQLTDAGASVYVAAGGCADRRMKGSVEDIFTDLGALGRIFGVQDAATKMINTARADLEAVADAVAGVRPRTVAQLYVEGGTLSAIGAGVEYDIVRRAGGKNVFGPDDEAFADFFVAQISPEEVAAREPEAIVFGVADEEHERTTREYLTRTFPDVPAVRDGRLIAVPSPDLLPGTLGNVNAVRRIATGLYPEALAE
ncbi:ABC transporter substrate-binding protein [Actinomadura sediminis]|uniref:ABC transporter substrate-binding protein n=1 Tax=Actinomadura sediminis TaxID=1038904 RepID=A0ABW3EXC4_9ACTN